MRKNFVLEPRGEWFELADEVLACWRQSKARTVLGADICA